MTSTSPGLFSTPARRWLENPGCGAVVGAFRFTDQTSQPVSPAIPPRLPGETPTDLALADPSSWRLHQVATFFDRKALDQVGRSVRPELSYVMDRELLYRVCRKFPVVISSKVYALFRRHEDSKSVSVILPFCREMASLHLLDAPPEEAPQVRRRRTAFVRHWDARGYLKLAKSRSPSAGAILALLRALRRQPKLLRQRSYWGRFLEALGLRSASPSSPGPSSPASSETSSGAGES